MVPGSAMRTKMLGQPGMAGIDADIFFPLACTQLRGSLVFC
jgi:hypothetical protein